MFKYCMVRILRAIVSLALVIPFSTDTWGNTVGRVNPFETVPDQSGRYKYMHVLSEPLTAEQFTTLYAEWKEAVATNTPEVP